MPRERSEPPGPRPPPGAGPRGAGPRPTPQPRPRPRAAERAARLAAAPGRRTAGRVAAPDRATELEPAGGGTVVRVVAPAPLDAPPGRATRLAPPIGAAALVALVLLGTGGKLRDQLAELS